MADQIRETFLERAGACLDHVRLVRWGTAETSYTVTDGE